MKRKVLLFLSILASCMSLTACDFVSKNDGDENIQKEKVEEREDSHKKEAEEDKDNEEKEDKKSGIQKELMMMLLQFIQRI